MLNTIKDLIKQKTAFQEAADLILEDEQIDDSIILLHEESDDLSGSDEVTEEENKDAPEEGEEPAENGDDEKPEEKPEETPAEEDKPEEDIMDQPIEDELPTPVGAQTGEPAEIGDGDILSTEIDLVTNTPNDTLPIPPAGAADVVPDADTTRVDSGFSNADVSEEDDSRDAQSEEEAADLLDLPIDEEAEIPDPNGVAKKEENPEEKAREDATPSEKTDEFKDTFAESFDILNESIDDVEECGDTAPEEKTEETEEPEPTEEKCEKKEEPEEEKKEETEVKEEKEAAPKTESSDKPNVKYDKMGDLANMSAQQIKASIDPGIKAKLESAGIFDQFIEAISIGDAPAEGDTAAPADTATDMPADTTAEPAVDQPADNAVTAAVKDKVSEMDASNADPNPSASKEAILKKLGSLSKAIEDTKNLVIDNAK